MKSYYDINLVTENMAPIERALLLKGFSSTKTPLKWIKFFRLCVLQKQKEKKKINNRNLLIIFSLLIVYLPLCYLLYDLMPLPIILGFILALFTVVYIKYKKREFRKKFGNGHEFFSDYFSALFTLIEEELPELGTIQLTANMEDSLDHKFLVERKDAHFKTQGFISGKEEFYEKEITKGTSILKDGSEVQFSFVEKTRKRIIRKRGTSGKSKVKYKYKCVFPFIVKIKFPKTTYVLKKNIASNIQLNEDENFYYLKVRRKFDVRKEQPKHYSQNLSGNSIELFPIEYFTLEVINLFNICFGQFNLKNN
ncbi:hypothetical protein ETU09_02930 [Apibacter muscae]|uniref:DUF3137 domain-containing protein n=1 Tax=Apibacter muscae TaxID=2509004 RepID=A0A563DGT2_9FLAO|nr:hypothetical protein [Apibacter muscae]TWP29415.1 hypothetical protein ETU09_02930 [Apibacter muscae]